MLASQGKFLATQPLVINDVLHTNYGYKYAKHQFMVIKHIYWYLISYMRPFMMIERQTEYAEMMCMLNADACVCCIEHGGSSGNQGITYPNTVFPACTNYHSLLREALSQTLSILKTHYYVKLQSPIIIVHSSNMIQASSQIRSC